MRATTTLVAGALLLACGAEKDNDQPPDPGTKTSAVTYYEDIKPLVDARCTGCHSEGGIAPFLLTDYDSVRVAAPAIKVAVQSRSMPPWLAADGCREYEHDISLDDAQIDLIASWVDDGAPAGDPSSATRPLEAELVELERVDLTIGMPEPYTPDPPAGELDDFRCFVVDWPEAKDVFVTGLEVRPGNLSVTHHLVAAIIPPEQAAAVVALQDADPDPGWGCGGGEMGMSGGLPGGGSGRDLFDQLQGAGLLAGWAPGNGASMFHPGTGLLVRPGSKILINMHYNVLAAGPAPDQTSIRFMVEDSVEKPAIAMFWANPAWPAGQMSIPANEPDVEHAWAFDPTLVLSSGEPLTIYGAMMHMHTFGTQTHLSVVRGGDDECLVDIPAWDFDWQLSYQFRQPTVINPGDQLRIECHYDNTAGHQPIVDGERIEPRDVSWGEGGTLDEMCLSAVLLTR